MISHFLAVLTSACAAAAAATSIPHPDFMLGGFNNANIVLSSGEKAVCATGDVDVGIQTTNQKLLFQEPRNQTEATEVLVELFQTNPTIYTRVNGGNNTFSATYKISSKLCYPASLEAAEKVQTIQLLTHGATLDKNYWDIPGFSYVDAAAQAGYATLTYDRLGVGLSEHPDPVQVVQAPAQVEILHGLAQLLRTGKLGGKAFKKIVGGGHSLGSIFTTGVTAKYPKDFDAAILTGFSANGTSVPTTPVSLDLEIANRRPEAQFRGLSNGYLTESTPTAVQFTFYRVPYFEQSVFDAQYAGGQTITFGELFTFGTAIKVSPNFTGPLDVMLPLNDFPFCGGDCTFPSDRAAIVRPALYPNAAAASRSVIVQRSGHNLNAHFGAQEAYAQINAFLEANGF